MFFFFPQAVSYTWVDLRIWEITLIKPLKRWYQCINPRTYTNSDVWPRKFWGSKLTASSVISSMAGRSTHCGIFQDMELMTWGLQGDAVCSHYQSGAMPGRLDGIGLGRPWPGTSIFCFFFWNIGWLWRLLMWYYSTPNQYIDHHPIFKETNLEPRGLFRPWLQKWARDSKGQEIHGKVLHPMVVTSCSHVDKRWQEYIVTRHTHQ